MLVTCDKLTILVVSEHSAVNWTWKVGRFGEIIGANGVEVIATIDATGGAARTKGSALELYETMSVNLIWRR